ncbi:5-carboxymethyl-2-hydroxymuconate Delta-isomerase [Variovorax paradoxus]|uniref:5-carboxymethyl-2-hydroxymuconate Delta-isomerase n=1 Tax=Variovorax paradoxus TaxID=34073 RepID=UPI00278449B0|nr:5-carboxymethyl-2-hydroxymuconate Delta-isomerase [Variovorax paradoxus]MDQ0589922.1 5-carboxymethyl-2-hydroxymuconate isomerase [Variovorax paradoxus]
MPHIIIEATASAISLVDPQTLTRTLHEAACGIDSYPKPGVRTRLHVLEHFRLADGSPDAGFVHVNIRIGTGFSTEARRAAAEALANQLSALFAPYLAATPIALSVEVTELDVTTRVNRSNVAQVLTARTAGA